MKIILTGGIHSLRHFNHILPNKSKVTFFNAASAEQYKGESQEQIYERTAAYVAEGIKPHSLEGYIGSGDESNHDTHWEHLWNSQGLILDAGYPNKSIDEFNKLDPHSKLNDPNFLAQKSMNDYFILAMCAGILPTGEFCSFESPSGDYLHLRRGRGYIDNVAIMAKVNQCKGHEASMRLAEKMPKEVMILSFEENCIAYCDTNSREITLLSSPHERYTGLRVYSCENGRAHYKTKYSGTLVYPPTERSSQKLKLGDSNCIFLGEDLKNEPILKENNGDKKQSTSSGHTCPPYTSIVFE